MGSNSADFEAFLHHVAGHLRLKGENSKHPSHHFSLTHTTCFGILLLCPFVSSCHKGDMVSLDLVRREVQNTPSDDLHTKVMSEDMTCASER